MVRELCMLGGEAKVNLACFECIIKKAGVAVISDYFRRHNLDISFGYLVHREHQIVKYVIFSQIDENTDMDALVNELSTDNNVIDLTWDISHDVSFQSIEFPLEFIGERAVITRATTFVDILRIISEYASQSTTLLFLSGLKGGSNAAKYFTKAAKLERKNLITIITELFWVAGWGKLVIDFDFESLKGTINVTDSFIADTFITAESPTCNYMSGYFSGFFSQVLGVNMFVSETVCKSTGNSYCEHTIYQAPRGSIEHLIKGDVV